MRWSGYVERRGKLSDVYTVSVGNLERKRLCRTRNKGEDNNEMVLKKQDVMMLKGIMCHRLESVADSYEYGGETSGCTKYG
jgi:hypothetical protein